VFNVGKGEMNLSIRVDREDEHGPFKSGDGSFETREPEVAQGEEQLPLPEPSHVFALLTPIVHFL